MSAIFITGCSGGLRVFVLLGGFGFPVELARYSQQR